MTRPQLNNRQEVFVSYLAQGCSGREAYQRAGYNVSDAVADVNASRLLTNAKVKARLVELQAKAASRAEATVDSIVCELEEARVGAMAARQYSAAAMASMGKAKLLGLIVDRAEVESLRKPLREPSNVKQMSIEEWQRAFAPKTASLEHDAHESVEPDKPKKLEGISITEALRRAEVGRTS